MKRAQKRGLEMEKLKTLMTLLIAREPLLPRHRDHALTNNWAGYRDAHIQPDWLIIYRIDGNVVRFERTGTHADLFD